jgi:hypothetical protein
MNYEGMSRFEINKWVWRLTKTGKTMHCHGPTIYKEATRYNEFNPCGNASDAWPVILSTGMSVELAHPDLCGIGTCTIYNPRGKDWQCDFDNNDDALWAAMVCFLKMKDEQDEQNNL